jgi:hypothetical protein
MANSHDAPDDFKAELVAASFLSGHPDVSKVIIDRLGDLSRSHTKDIYRMDSASAWPDPHAMLVLQSFRQGIYDLMPENVFHPASLGGVGMSAEEILVEITLQRKREQDARAFFKPFEQEASYVEIEALLLELMYEKKGKNNDLIKLFDKAWPVLKKMPPETALGFVYVLPLLYQVRGNKLWTEQCLSFLTGFPAVITEHYEWIKPDRKLPSFSTGANRLGIDTNLGGKQYDGMVDWNIHIGPINEEAVDAMLTQTDFNELLHILSGYFIPASISVRYIIRTEKAADTVLSSDRNTARLGYTFFL